MLEVEKKLKGEIAELEKKTKLPTEVNELHQKLGKQEEELIKAKEVGQKRFKVV